MSNITVIGTGYVGLVAGAMLSDFGHSVVCMDNDSLKIEGLKNGVIPIYEEGLAAIVERNTAYKRLSFTSDIAEAVLGSEIIFIAVGTPPGEDGSADLQYVLSAARSIAEHMDGYRVIVDKSTVPVGTARQVKHAISEALKARGADYDFDVVSNPEFLREGSAVYDFTHPDRVVIGCDSEKALDKMKEVYRVLYLNETPFIETDSKTAEMIKYASNSFLAVKITFINEIANICDEAGADVKKIAKAMGLDGRISSKFLHPGPGYGGSCFPKDVKALHKTSKDYMVESRLLKATIEANEAQKLRMVDKIKKHMNDISGMTIAVLGVTFKPNTDDCREAPSLTILPELVKAGAMLRVFDPQGRKEGERLFKHLEESVTWCADEYDALKGSRAAILLTEWNVFRNIDFSKADCLEVLFDLRNVYNRRMIEDAGLRYVGVGTTGGAHEYL